MILYITILPKQTDKFKKILIKIVFRKMITDHPSLTVSKKAQFLLFQNLTKLKKNLTFAIQTKPQLNLIEPILPDFDKKF